MPKPYIAKFRHRLYRATVVLLYHPELETEQLFQYAATQDKILQKYGDDPNWSEIMAMVLSMTPSRRIYLLMGRTATVSELLHETLHVTTQLFQGIGSEHTLDTEENFAYTQTLVFEDCYDFLLPKLGEHQARFLRQKPTNNQKD